MKPKTVFDSLEELLTPTALSELLCHKVQNIWRQPLEVAHLSGNELEGIRVETDSGRIRLILKRFKPDRDWVMRLTHDTLTREAMLFAHGVYARMSDEVVVPILAAARDGETWATLMRDVSQEMLAANTSLTENDARLLIEQLAAIHAQFWNDSALDDPTLGLSSLYDFVTILSPARVQAELDTGRAHPVMELAARGWKQYDATAPEDVRGIVNGYHADPTSLLHELEQLPQTLLHGDYKLGNLGIVRAGARSLKQNTSPGGPPNLVVLDWQDATRGAGVLDLGFFLALNARWLPFDKEKAIQIYSNSLAARRLDVSAHEIEIGLLAGGALRLLWSMVLNQPNELDWWYDLVRRFKTRK